METSSGARITSDGHLGRQSIPAMVINQWLAAVSGALLLLSCSRAPNVRKAEFLEKGEKYFQAFKYEEAVIEFRDAIQIDPRFAEARYQLGRSYLRLGNNQAAYRELRSAVDLDPAHRDAKLEFAGLLVRLRQFSEAEKIAQELVKADPPMSGLT